MMLIKLNMMNIKRILNSKHGQSIFTQLGGSVIALISFMILARVFSKETFGEWALYLTIITFVDMVKSGMVQSAFIKYASGSSEADREAFLGTSWLLNLGLIVCISVINFFLFQTGFFEMKAVVYFLWLYPAYALVSMPFNYYMWNNQMLLDFKRVAMGRGVNLTLFLFVAISSIWFSFELFELLLLHLLSFLVSSIWAIRTGKTGIRNLFSAKKSVFKKYLNFGKFHSLAFLGSNLLKSSDTFLITAFLGPLYVAIYSIPLRLIELIEMPLKGAVSVAYPVFSAADNKGDYYGLKISLEKYIGVLTILYLPFMALLYLLSDELVLLVGGDKYAEAGNIFRIFVIYGLFLPFDRLTGIVLDAMGHPRLNFYKVLIMAGVNIIGDVIVLHYFQSLELVAVVTITNVLAGMLVGFYISYKRLNISLKSIFTSGFNAIYHTGIKLLST